MYDKRGRRLTSWKEIADHMGRDVRTMLRWEKGRGLPIHRVPGATGRVVFAFTGELDSWARGPAALEVTPPVIFDAPVAEAVIPVAALPVPRGSRRWLARAAAVLAALGLAWPMIATPASEPLTIAWTAQGIVASGPDGSQRWRYPFPPNERIAPPAARTDRVGDVLGAPEPGVLTATSMRTQIGSSLIRSGQLLWMTPDGTVRRSLSIEDRLMFGAVAYGAPWSITDFRVDPSGGPRRVAVSAHHYEWWPSIVTVYDAGWRRRGTFVNAGWVEQLQWVSRDRLLIAGFSNVLDGGMLAALDPSALDGQSPAPPGSGFACTSCGPASPLRYIVMARSEVNRASASPFNRAQLTAKADSFLVRTIEMAAGEPGGPADALYEFTPSLEVTRATYSDRYWEMHRRLEVQGRISHTREHCPDRDGPREVRVWEPAAGWRTVPIPR